MLTDEGRQKSDEGLRRGVNELFPQAVLLTMRVSIEPLMTGGCSIAHTLTPLPPTLLLLLLYIAAHSSRVSICLAHAHTYTHTRTFPQTRATARSQSSFWWPTEKEWGKNTQQCPTTVFTLVIV